MYLSNQTSLLVLTQLYPMHACLRPFSGSSLLNRRPTLCTLSSHASVPSSTTIPSTVCSSTFLFQPLGQLQPISFFSSHPEPSVYLFYITLDVCIFQDNCFQVLCFLMDHKLGYLKEWLGFCSSL